MHSAYQCVLNRDFSMHMTRDNAIITPDFHVELQDDRHWKKVMVNVELYRGTLEGMCTVHLQSLCRTNSAGLCRGYTVV